MDWTIQDLGALGELVSAFAVVVTLLYVGIQLKQNTQAVRSATMQSVFEATNEVWKNSCQDLSRAEQFISVAAKPDHNDAEALFYLSWTILTFRAQENIYYQRKLGSADDNFVSLEKRVRGSLSRPDHRRAWDEGIAKNYLSDEYIEFVERVIRTLPNADGMK
jgi:hypothetical protein